MDERLLEVDWNHLRLGGGDLGNPPKTSRGVGGRPLGASPRRLGVDRGSLAVVVKRVNTDDGRLLLEGVFKLLPV